MVNPLEGQSPYDENFDKFMEDYLCPIELEPLTTAIRLNCSHHVNETALSILGKKKETDSRVKVEMFCPLCRIPVSGYQADEKMRKTVRSMIQLYQKRKQNSGSELPQIPASVESKKECVPLLSKGKTLDKIENQPKILTALPVLSEIRFKGEVLIEEGLTCLHLVSTTSNSSLDTIDLIKQGQQVIMTLHFREGAIFPEFVELLACESTFQDGFSLSFNEIAKLAIVCEWIFQIAVVPADCRQAMRTVVGF